GGEREYVLAVREHDEARFLSVEESFDQDPAARSAQRALDEDPLDGTMGLVCARGHDHALSGGEPVGLHDDGRTARVDIGVRGGRRVEARELRGGNSVPYHE